MYDDDDDDDDDDDLRPRLCLRPGRGQKAESLQEMANLRHLRMVYGGREMECIIAANSRQ